MQEPFAEQKRQYSTVAQTIEFIRSNARQQPSLAAITALVNLSESHLQRIFSEWAGISPKRFLQYLTKENAKHALLGSMNVLSATLESGLIKVWEALLNIGSSRLFSYSTLAHLANSPKSQRVVGSALAANKIGFLIPCHRVIRETGDAGIYRWESNSKIAMHTWEIAKNNKESF